MKRVEAMRLSSGRPAVWRRASVDALLVCCGVLGVYVYWFVVADRSVVFLYGATADGLPRFEPFDAMTRSRYWMAGLVADGAVAVAYPGVYWLAGRIAAARGARFRAPTWPSVAALCTPVLAAGIPAVTALLGSPTLPPSSVAATTLAVLAGLAPALWPAAWAAERPGDLAWLTADALGLVPVLLLFRVVEFPSHDTPVTPSTAWSVALGSVTAGLVWLAVLTAGLRCRRRRPPDVAPLLTAALAAAYLLVPLLHYGVAEPGYRYITDASNVFAFSVPVQLVTVLVALALASTATVARRRVLPPGS